MPRAPAKEERRVGRPPKPYTYRELSIRIDAELYRQLRHYAVDANLSFSDLMDLAMKEWWGGRPESAKYADAKEGAR